MVWLSGDYQIDVLDELEEIKVCAVAGTMVNAAYFPAVPAASPNAAHF